MAVLDTKLQSNLGSLSFDFLSNKVLPFQSEILALSNPHRQAVEAWVASLQKRAKNEVYY